MYIPIKIKIHAKICSILKDSPRKKHPKKIDDIGSMYRNGDALLADKVQIP